MFSPDTTCFKKERQGGLQEVNMKRVAFPAHALCRPEKCGDAHQVAAGRFV